MGEKRLTENSNKVDQLEEDLAKKEENEKTLSNSIVALKEKNTKLERKVHDATESEICIQNEIVRLQEANDQSDLKICELEDELHTERSNSGKTNEGLKHQINQLQREAKNIKLVEDKMEVLKEQNESLKNQVKSLTKNSNKTDQLEK